MVDVRRADDDQLRRAHELAQRAAGERRSPCRSTRPGRSAGDEHGRREVEPSSRRIVSRIRWSSWHRGSGLGAPRRRASWSVSCVGRSSVAGRPVRARKTSSSVGRRSPMSSMSTSASASAAHRVGQAIGAVDDGHGDPAGRRVDARRPRCRAGRAASATPLPGRRRGGPGSRPCPGRRAAFSSSGVPVAMARPWSMITTWSASWSASSRYCVVSSTSVPAWTSARMASHSSIRLRGSSPVVGSSSSSSRGVPTRLAPRSRRRRMPPE